MSKVKKWMWFSILFISLLGSTSLYARSDNLRAFLDMARQTGNIYWVLQVYGMRGTNLNYNSPDKILQETIAEFEKSIEETEKSFPDPVIQKSLASIRREWEPVKKSVLDAFTNKTSGKLDKEEPRIHQRFWHMVQDLETIRDQLLIREKFKNQKALTDAISLGSSAKSLSAHYILKMWGIKDPLVKKHWEEEFIRFKSALENLKQDAALQDRESKSLMKLIEKKTFYLEMMFRINKEYLPASVTKVCNEIQQASERLVEIFLDYTEAH